MFAINFKGTGMDINSSDANRDSVEEFSNKFYTLLDAGAGVIQVRTHEVLRAALEIRKLCIADGFEIREWDIVNGFRTFDEHSCGSLVGVGDGNNIPPAAFSAPLEQLRDKSQQSIRRCYVYVNFHPFIESPDIQHLITLYSYTLPASNTPVIIVTPDIPLTVENENILSLHFDPPGFKELRSSLETVIDQVRGDFDDGISLTDSDISRICFVGAGMTKNAFDMYTSLAVVEAGREGRTSITADEIATGVAIGKTEVVNQSEVLELYPPTDINNVGGLDNLKEWISKRKGCYSDEAREFGIEPPKGIVLVGVPGCLAGDTEVTYLRGARKGGRVITLEDLYRKFNGLPTSSRGWADLSIPTYTHSLDPEGVVFYNRIVSVIEAGMKECIAISFSDGSRLVLTGNHPVATPGGRYVPADSLVVGDSVLARGSMKPVSGGGRNLDARPPRNIVNTKYHPHGAVKYVQDGEVFYEYKRVAKARLVIEAHMNRMDYSEFVHALKYNRSLASSFTFLDPIYEVHHVDEDTLNDDLSNLMVLHKVEHARQHSKTENFNVEYVREVTVVSIESAGAHMTYDVQMDMPANNFVANGILVHNTGKSLVAKAVASEFGIPLVRLDFGRVFNSLVGASENRMRQALRQVENMAPVVLFADEIDKGLGGIGSGGDSGVSSRVLGSFLTWLQDCKKPVFVMVTANNVTGLPPEMLRRGRFDAIFSTTMPNPHERREVLRIHLKLRGRNIKDFDSEEVDALVRQLDGYVPAEIESAVKDALVDAFSSGEDLTLQHIAEAARAMVPLSKAFKEQIDRMSAWAENNATPASKPSGEDLQSDSNNSRNIRRRRR